MIDYKIHKDGVEILDQNGSVFPIYFNEHSGNVYYRYKIGTISSIKHPGIYVGRDASGKDYILHNHYLRGKAFIDTWEGFSQERSINLHNTCTNPPNEVIRIGLEQVKNGEKYTISGYNCQTFTNQACHNVRRSEDVERWTARIGVGAFFLTLIGIAFSGD